MKRLLRLFPTKWWEMGTLLCVGVLPASLLFFFLRGQAGSPNAPPQDWQAPAVEIIQLPSEDGVIPVEIRRAKAHFKSPNEIDDTTIVVKNNTNNSILAIALQIAITTETEGNRSVKASFLTSDSFIHQDIQRANKIKPFVAGDVQVLDGTSVAYPVGTLIRNIAIKLDYVEFGDGMWLGPDKGDGRRVISQTRAGAVKYKSWLAEKYARAGRSMAAVLSAVETDDFPSELGLDNSYQTNGAAAYQRYLRETYKLQGADEVMKHFGKPNQ